MMVVQSVRDSGPCDRKRGLPLLRVTPVLAVTFVLILCSGCGGDGGVRPAPSGSPTGSVAGASEPVSSVEDLDAVQITLPGDPDWLAADEHGVWIQRASGEVTLIDPATNEVLRVVDVGDPQLCAGLGAAYGSIWTCLGPDVLRLDPDSLKTLARYKIHKQAQHGHLVGAFNRLWVLTSDGSHLVGIEPSTNKVASEHQLPARCRDVTVGTNALWLPCLVDDRVLKLDPESGKVLLNLKVDNPMHIAADTDVWVGTAATTVQLDPDTGEVLLEAGAGVAPDGALALDGGTVWVRNGDDFLIQLDRTTGERIGQITADVTSGGDILVREGEVWTAAYDDQLLFRINPDR